MLKSLSSISKRHVVMGADQAVSSVSNLLLAVGIAHTVSSSQFGVYAIIASIYWLCLGTQRAGIAEPLLIRWDDFAGESPGADERVLGLSIVLGVLGGAVFLVFLVFPTLRPLVALGAILPALLVQDTLRYCLFARGSPTGALAADFVWMVVEIVLGAVAIITHETTVVVWVLVWGLGAVVSVVALGAWARLWPAFGGTLAWARLSMRMSLQMLGDFFLNTGAQQGIIFIVPVISSLRTLGALKAAQLAVSPLQVVLTSVSILVLPGISRAGVRGDMGKAMRRGAQVAALGISMGVIYAGVLAVLPADVGRVLFGDSWGRGARIAPIIALQIGFMGISFGALVFMRGTRTTGRILIVRTFVTPVNVALPIVGLLIGGLQGLALFMAATALLASVAWWRAARHAGSVVPVTAPEAI
jgi:O-antigen/teichoic acid export membrane protein